MFRLPIIYTCFPGGKHKVLTMSYDDGRKEDYRLLELFNKHGIKGTFNLNAGIDWDERRIPQSEYRTLYEGHEIACHTFTHPTIARSPLDQVAQQILADRRGLEQLIGRPVRGLAYPNGSYSKEIIIHEYKYNKDGETLTQVLSQQIQWDKTYTNNSIIIPDYYSIYTTNKPYFAN